MVGTTCLHYSSEKISLWSLQTFPTNNYFVLIHNKALALVYVSNTTTVICFRINLKIFKPATK